MSDECQCPKKTIHPHLSDFDRVVHFEVIVVAAIDRDLFVRTYCKLVNKTEIDLFLRISPPLIRKMVFCNQIPDLMPRQRTKEFKNQWMTGHQSNR